MTPPRAATTSSAGALTTASAFPGGSPRPICAAGSSPMARPCWPSRAPAHLSRPLLKAGDRRRPQNEPTICPSMPAASRWISTLWPRLPSLDRPWTRRAFSPLFLEGRCLHRSAHAGRRPRDPHRCRRQPDRPPTGCPQRTRHDHGRVRIPTPCRMAAASTALPGWWQRWKSPVR